MTLRQIREGLLKSKLRCRQQTAIVHRSRVLNDAVELYSIIRGWYEYRDGYSGGKEFDSSHWRDQQIFRDLFTVNNIDWLPRWQYPLQLAKAVVILYARLNGKDVRSTWKYIARTNSREFRLVVSLVRNAGETTFTEHLGET